MTTRTLYTLAELSYSFGLIGSDEYRERRLVAKWLGDNAAVSDPREPSLGQAVETQLEPDDEARPTEPAGIRITGKLDEPGWMEFLFQKRWLFTRADPDDYPSTPHGHFQNANRAWPKLNPYTGRAFKAKHQEDPSLRLGKKAMRELWQTEAFRDFCRSHILWYMQENPPHRFPTSHPLRFPRW